ncbi:MAG TPA: FkbM family methyltransferase, partial [Dehalococcoidia bacterium]|nr:FkbM family methyltransferase [Dehalococcoidia bacterium]
RLQRRLMPGTTFVDVGAHLGHYVLLAARAVGRSGRVIALEPAPHTYRLLRESVRANKLRHVTVLPVAAGSRHGRRAFHLADWSLCQGFYEHPYPFARPLRPTEVDVRPLDEVVPGPVDAVKVDVEGAELEVLEGMRRILAENPTLTLVVEWNPDCMIRAGRDPLDLPRVIGSYGFRLDTVLDAGAGLDRWPQPVAAEWVARMIQEHRLPPRWYGNLWAERGDSAS